MIRIVRLDCDVFDLGAGTIADFEGCGNLAFFSGRHFLLLRLRNRAPARGVDGFKPHRLAAGVLIFEMADRLFVPGCRMQFDRGLFPFQFRARDGAKKDRQCKSENACSHFCE